MDLYVSEIYMNFVNLLNSELCYVATLHHVHTEYPSIAWLS